MRGYSDKIRDIMKYLKREDGEPETIRIALPHNCSLTLTLNASSLTLKRTAPYGSSSTRLADFVIPEKGIGLMRKWFIIQQNKFDKSLQIPDIVQVFHILTKIKEV